MNLYDTLFSNAWTEQGGGGGGSTVITKLYSGAMSDSVTMSLGSIPNAPSSITMKVGDVVYEIVESEDEPGAYWSEDAPYGCDLYPNKGDMQYGSWLIHVEAYDGETYGGEEIEISADLGLTYETCSVEIMRDHGSNPGHVPIPYIMFVPKSEFNPDGGILLAGGITVANESITVRGILLDGMILLYFDPQSNVLGETVQGEYTQFHDIPAITGNCIVTVSTSS